MDREARWVRAVQRRGSRAAAEKLIERYYREMYVFCYRQTGNEQDALDLTQAVFAAMLHAIARYDRRRASFRTWLYRVAAHKVIDARRRGRTRERTLPLDEADAAEPYDFSAAVHDRELLERIEQFVTQFDPDVQAVFRLRLYGELTFPEIAAVTGQPESTAKSQYHRLLARIRKEFDPHG